MNRQKTHPKKKVFNPFEQVVELGKDTVKKAGEEMVNIVNPFPDMWGSPTPKPESMPGGPNFSPVDFDKLDNHYDNQDASGIDKIREQLMGFQSGDEDQEKLKRHREYKQEEEEFYMKQKQEEAEKERQEAAEEEQKKLAEEQAHQQPLEAPKGKVRKNILGGGHKKANMELPPEVRSERKGGAGKH